MVKRQKERQYNSARENREYAQLRKNERTGDTVQRQLPFSHCALTLLPFESPVCTRDGIIFENSAILPFLLEHKQDPVTGKTMTSRDLITLQMDQNEETGEWQCPVLTKAFADHTKIVAIVQPDQRHAYVYSFEAYAELNLKAKNFTDLISGEPFRKDKDVILLNDPENSELNQLRDINRFHHVVQARVKEHGKVSSSSTGQVRRSITATRIFEQLAKNKSQQTTAVKSVADATSKKRSRSSEEEETLPNDRSNRILASDVTGVQYTTGQASTSFTSTSMMVAYDNGDREATPEEIIMAQLSAMRKLKQKAHVRLRTTQGSITLQIHCDMVPRTCANFLGLCEQGQYDGTNFHRLIPNFMIQGGKALSGKPDESHWGDAFVDEFDDRLKHCGRGIVSMANAGRNDNKRQFFITFKACPHLDRKHSVFGQVVDGMDVLGKWESIGADNKERPLQDIKILSTEIVGNNPWNEALKLEKERMEKLVLSRNQKAPSNKKSIATSISQADPTAAFTTEKQSTDLGIGRYLKDKVKAQLPGSASASATTSKSAERVNRLPAPPKKTTFGNFGGW